MQDYARKRDILVLEIGFERENYRKTGKMAVFSLEIAGKVLEMAFFSLEIAG